LFLIQNLLVIYIDTCVCALIFKAGIGPSTRNNQSKLIALKLDMLLAKEKGLTHLQVMGDSQIVIKWMSEEVELRKILLQPFFRDTKHLQSTFIHITFDHIYRENNKEADRLSKDGLYLHEGIWEIKETQHGHISTYLHESCL
jgi:ribonuclease HI